MNILIVDDEVTALRDMARVLKKVVPDAAVKKADEADAALALVRKQAFDVVFLDINMPGKDGLALAKEMKRIRPMLNIVMATAYTQHVLDAVRLYVSDYILKPVSQEAVRSALSNLRNPVVHSRKGLFVQCFGAFEVFYDGKPVRFGRAKAKELFAYLVDRMGASVTNSELRAVLWKDEAVDTEKQLKYFAQIVHQLRSCLEELGVSDVLVRSRDSYAVAVEKIPCDYYFALMRDAQTLSSYEGEYMSQYEWAMFHAGNLSEFTKLHGF